MPGSNPNIKSIVISVLNKIEKVKVKTKEVKKSLPIVNPKKGISSIESTVLELMSMHPMNNDIHMEFEFPTKGRFISHYYGLMMALSEVYHFTHELANKEKVVNLLYRIMAWEALGDIVIQQQHESEEHAHFLNDAIRTNGLLDINTEDEILLNSAHPFDEYMSHCKGNNVGVRAILYTPQNKNYTPKLVFTFNDDLGLNSDIVSEETLNNLSLLMRYSCFAQIDNLEVYVLGVHGVERSEFKERDLCDLYQIKTPLFGQNQKITKNDLKLTSHIMPVMSLFAHCSFKSITLKSSLYFIEDQTATNKKEILL